MSKFSIVNDAYELVSTTLLREHPDNPNEGDVGAICESIEENGFYGTLLVNRRTNHILAGNHRFKAAKAQGATQLPVVFIDVEPSEEIRYLLIDNRAARLSRDNDEQLAEILTKLHMHSDRGLAGTGYTADDLDALIAQISEYGQSGGAAETGEGGENGEGENGEGGAGAPVRCSPGETWMLGTHRLRVGDNAREADGVLAFWEQLTGDTAAPFTPSKGDGALL